MKAKVFYLILIGLLIAISQAKAQLKYKIENGMIHINDGPIGRFNEKAFTRLIDSLEKNLKSNPNDTTSLFDRALLYSLGNNLLAKPYPREKMAVENLIIGKNEIERAVSCGMSSLGAKVLRAQLYKDIIYRYSGDASWMFNKQQIEKRRTDYNAYKDLANKDYDEVIMMSKSNAWDFEKLKIKTDYPIK
jgi:hypothetical protein